jgi:16S rRNA U1498 N3-methylase RsmE
MTPKELDAPVERHNNLSRFDNEMQRAIIESCQQTTAIHAPGVRPCVELGHACFRCQERARAALNTSEKR